MALAMTDNSPSRSLAGGTVVPRASRWLIVSSVVHTPGSITKWSRLAGVFALVAVIVPEGVYRWTTLSIAGGLLVVAATRVPRQAWGSHKVLLAALGCVVVAILAAELIPLGAAATAWTVGTTGAVFVGVVVFNALRMIRRR
jgi:hypothetical protein